MRKVLLLSAAFTLFYSIVIAQDAKVQKVEPKVQKQAPKVQKQESKVVKPIPKDQKIDAKTQKQEVNNEENNNKGYYRTEWDKKIITDLKLTPEQIAKFDAINQEYYEKSEALKVTKVKTKPKQSSISAAVEQTASEASTSVTSEDDLLKQNEEPEKMKEEKNEKLQQLQNDKEKMIIELLTSEQQSLYLKMLENKKTESGEKKKEDEKKKEVNQKKIMQLDPDN